MTKPDIFHIKGKKRASDWSQGRSLSSSNLSAYVNSSPLLTQNLSGGNRAVQRSLSSGTSTVGSLLSRLHLLDYPHRAADYDLLSVCGTGATAKVHSIYSTGTKLCFWRGIRNCTPTHLLLFQVILDHGFCQANTVKHHQDILVYRPNWGHMGLTKDNLWSLLIVGVQGFMQTLEGDCGCQAGRSGACWPESGRNLSFVCVKKWCTFGQFWSLARSRQMLLLYVVYAN